MIRPERSWVQGRTGRGGWPTAAPWLAVVLFVSGGLLLLVTTVRRGRDLREEALAELYREVRVEAANLEALLSRLERELNDHSEVQGPWSNARGQSLVAETRGHLLDMGSVLAGVAVVDPRGNPISVVPESLRTDSLIMAFLTETLAGVSSQGVGLRTGGAFLDGRAAAIIYSPLTGEEEEYLGQLSILVALDALAPLTPSPPGFEGDPTFALLDEEGGILVHPRRDWIGYLYLTDADSLYDPELHAILPEILGNEPGAWSLVSEVLAPGSWGAGRRSLLAFSPVSLPGGGRWRLGISLVPGEGIFPGIPTEVTVSFSMVLLSLLLMVSGFAIPRRQRLARELEEASHERDWLAALMNAGADGLLVFSPDQRVVAANEALSRLIGWPHGEVLGVPYVDLLDNPEPLMDADGRVDLPMGRSEARLRSMDGPPLDVELNTAEFAHVGEDFILAMVRDATWRQRLERETLRVGERERLLLGKELHDGLGQHLTGVAFMAKTLAKKLVGRRVEGAAEAEEIGQLVKDAVGQIRILSKGLELSEYVGEDLPKGLEEMAGVVRRLMGVEFDLVLGEEMRKGVIRLDRSQATQVYRLCHEVVSEAVRGRLAHRIRVELGPQGDRMVLKIHHDGAKPSDGDQADGGLPAFRLRYRARLLGASLKVVEDPAGGVTTTCSFQVDGEGT